LHGDRTQAQRERALRSVKNGQIQVLVATDVAARGIHIELLPVVIHYDPPAQATDYLHRSGRTGRAGATGAVISLVGEDVIGQVRRLQKALGINASIETREDAQPIRLGAVDDAVAAERLDDRGGKGRSERSTPRDHDRGPRGFERTSRERSFSDRPRGERPSSERGPRTPRTFSDRPERSDRAPRTFTERSDRAPRPFADRPERSDRSPARASSDRVERAPRNERVFTDRAPRPERSTARDTHFTKGASSARGSEAIVSFFNDSKGFGFASDDKGDDLFIHFSNIVGDGFKSLAQGQKITFEEANGPKGREARNVRVVGGGRERRR
jgi:superfamily II DNA/RNA helicase/cold shock CspA family protein